MREGMAIEIRVNAMGFVRSNYCMVMQVEKTAGGGGEV
jgi:hypothetical protein